MKINRLQVLEKYGGKCAYCGRGIDLKSMQIDHMIPRCIGGKDDIENLNPACRKCNHYKRSQTVNGFRVSMKDLHTRISKIYIHEVAVNFGMATIKPFDGTFYFEKLTNRTPATVTGEK